MVKTQDETFCLQSFVLVIELPLCICIVLCVLGPSPTPPHFNPDRSMSNVNLLASDQITHDPREVSLSLASRTDRHRLGMALSSI